jgi:hypothetical protein
VDRRGELGEAMMAAGANVDAAAERVGGALMADAWAEGQSLSHHQGRWCLLRRMCVQGSEHVLLYVASVSELCLHGRI